MTDQELWKMAQEQAIKEYECNWEDADKYEREDCVFSKYMELKMKTTTIQN